MSALQGAKPSRKLWNHRLNTVLDTLNIKKRASDYGFCVQYYCNNITILNLFADDAIVIRNNQMTHQDLNKVFPTYF